MRTSRRLILFVGGAAALCGLVVLVWKSGYWVSPNDLGTRIAWWAIGWIVLGVNGVGAIAIVGGAVVGGVGYGVTGAVSWVCTGDWDTVFLAAGQLAEQAWASIEAWWWAEKPAPAVVVVEEMDADEAAALRELDEEFPGTQEAW